MAYIDVPPATLGKTCDWSTDIVQARVESVDRVKNVIVWKKCREYKGKWRGTDVIRQTVNALPEPHRTAVLKWAEPGKMTVMFALESYRWSHTYINNLWYASTTTDWTQWNGDHIEPVLLRTYCGRTNKLQAVVDSILAGKEVVVACLGDEKDAAAGRVRGMRASLKLLDYNAKRDFAKWGGDDFTPLLGMPGFSRFATLAAVGRDAMGISVADFNGDGKPDICLVAANHVALIQNDGGAMLEATIPGLLGGARAACWADFDGDGKPDLFLGTPSGPKLYRNLGSGNFQDVSYLIPRSPYWNITAAAWIDYDGDGKPDLLIADGFRGLRLYRNLTGKAEAPLELAMGKWSQCGPFDNTGHKGYDTAYPPEQGIDFKGVYPGKNDQQAGWREVDFPDGRLNSVKIYREQDHTFLTVYLHRQITSNKAVELPISLGSGGPLRAWLNGQKVLDNNVQRSPAPDQVKLALKLKAGSNDLLIKACFFEHGKSTYFNATPSADAMAPQFEDVSDSVGLGLAGAGGSSKGDALLVADVNEDGRPDILYSAGSGILILNTPDGFKEARDCGISYKAGKVVPAFGKMDGAGALDLFVPQLDGRCRLFKNDGHAHFTDVTDKAGDLARPMGTATSAAWADLHGTGHPDLIVGCLKSPNRLFRNKGDGTFADATEECGFEKHIFNTQAVQIVDLRQNGTLDVIFNNEGQESVLLMGDSSHARLQPPVTSTPANVTNVIAEVASPAPSATSATPAPPVVASIVVYAAPSKGYPIGWMIGPVVLLVLWIGMALVRAQRIRRFVAAAVAVGAEGEDGLRADGTRAGGATSVHVPIVPLLIKPVSAANPVSLPYGSRQVGGCGLIIEIWRVESGVCMSAVITRDLGARQIWSIA